MRHILSLVLILVSGSAWASVDEDRLTSAINEYTESVKRLDAYMSHYYGVEVGLSQFGDYLSPDYFKRSKDIYKKALTQIAQVKPDRLPVANRRTYRLFKEHMEVALEGFAFPQEFLSFNQFGNRMLMFINDANPAYTRFPFDSVKHYEAFVERAEGFPAYVDREIENLRKAVRQGYAHNCFVAKRTLNTFQAGLLEEVEQNPFWKPMTVLPAIVSPRQKNHLGLAYRRMILEIIVPAYKKFDVLLSGMYPEIPAYRCSKALLHSLRGKHLCGIYWKFGHPFARSGSRSAQLP